VAFNYTGIAATALKLLENFGGPITLSRTTGDSIDPITGVVIAGTDSSVATTGLLKVYPDKMIDGTRILSGDRELILSNEQEVTTTDKPIIDGEEWSIEEIKTLKPFDVVIIYFCRVRK